MRQARNNSRQIGTERRCPTCEGSGELTIRHYTGDPQLETEAPCPEPRCLNGWIEWREPDPLVVMSRKRKFRKAQGGPRWMVGYWDARAAAMAPVKLPRIVSRLDAQAQRDAFAAIERTAEFNRMVMAPFHALLGRAA